MPHLRFTIRDVLWLTLVVGLAVGWWVDRGRVADEHSKLARYAQEQEARANRESAWSKTVYTQWDELLLANTEQVATIANLKEKVGRLEAERGTPIDDEPHMLLLWQDE